MEKPKTKSRKPALPMKISSKDLPIVIEFEDNGRSYLLNGTSRKNL